MLEFQQQIEIDRVQATLFNNSKIYSRIEIMSGEEEQCTANHTVTAGDGDEAPAMVKMVEMPVEYLEWVLAQRKEDYRVPTLEDYSPEELDEAREEICRAIAALQVAFDEFAEFRAWVRGLLAEDGRVMVREDVLVPDLRGLQESVDYQWAAARRELAMASCCCDAEEETMTRPLGPHTYTLSTCLALLYEYICSAGPDVLGAVGR